MKKYICIVLIAFLLYGCKTIILHEDNTIIYYNINLDKKIERLYKYYPWLNVDLYNLVYKNCVKNKVPIELAFAIIQAETQGRHIRGFDINKNGSYDYGIMQVNEIHCKKDSHCKGHPEKLMELPFNIKKGCSILGKAYHKAKNSSHDPRIIIARTSRFYNQGLYGKWESYKGYKYVGKVLKAYSDTTKEVK